jgi:hypothetical protein
MSVHPNERYDAMFYSLRTPSTTSNVIDVTQTVPEYLKELYNDAVTRLATQRQKETLAKLLVDYKDVFAKSPEDIGRTTLIKHDIDTGNEPPVKQRCRRSQNVI